MLFKNSVRTSKRTPHFTITKINWLTLFKEITNSATLVTANYSFPQHRILHVYCNDSSTIVTIYNFLSGYHVIIFCFTRIIKHPRRTYFDYVTLVLPRMSCTARQIKLTTLKDLLRRRAFQNTVIFKINYINYKDKRG
jgi:uncharacterized protein (UPF0248 family)